MSKFARCCYIVVPTAMFTMLLLLLVGAFSW